MDFNKIDREGADIDRTKADLSNNGLQPEEWGGDTTMVPISAKLNQNLDQLLDMILLTADIEELKADIEIPAEGRGIKDWGIYRRRLNLWKSSNYA